MPPPPPPPATPKFRRVPRASALRPTNPEQTPPLSVNVFAPPNPFSGASCLFTGTIHPPPQVWFGPPLPPVEYFFFFFFPLSVVHPFPHPPLGRTPPPPTQLAGLYNFHVRLWAPPHHNTLIFFIFWLRLHFVFVFKKRGLQNQPISRSGTGCRVFGIFSKSPHPTFFPPKLPGPPCVLFWFFRFPFLCFVDFSGITIMSYFPNQVQGGLPFPRLIPFLHPHTRLALFLPPGGLARGPPWDPPGVPVSKQRPAYCPALGGPFPLENHRVRAEFFPLVFLQYVGFFFSRSPNNSAPTPTPPTAPIHSPPSR